MAEICLNSQVWDRYRSGYNLNNAIQEVFQEEIDERADKSKSFASMTPLQMVMSDAGIKKSSCVGDMVNPKVNNSAYTYGGMDTNQWLFPAFVETTLRENLYETDYLPYICDTRIGVDSVTVQSPLLNLLDDKNKKAIKKARIAEGADIPTGKITIGERAITLWKRGRAIEFTYEAARRMRIDLFTRQMRAIASDLAHQEIEAAVDVLINGDGNTGTEASKLMTTAKAGEVSPEDIIQALFDYSSANYYNADTMIVPKKYLLPISLMMYDKNLVLGAGLQVKFNIPQVNNQNVTVIGLEEVKINNKDAIILSNRSMALARYEENGSNIQEMDNFIRNQTKLMTLTENSGYALMTAGANRYIEIKQGS